MKVLVTGANGHLGQNLVTELVKRGHAVRASVRDARNTYKTRHLTELPGVEIVEADLFRPDTLRSAMAGIDVLCHGAAVYTLITKGHDQDVIDASVKGVDAVMRAAKDAGVRKVVLTSSVVTLPLTMPGAPPVAEDRWQTDLGVPYIRAKVEGERTAWRLAEDLGVALVTILPGAFGGPGFTRPTPTIDVVDAIMHGSLAFGTPPLDYPYCDVRDVARAHALAVEQDAHGRYIATNDHAPSLTEMGTIMSELDKSVPRPGPTLPAFTTRFLPWIEVMIGLFSGAPRTLPPEMAAIVRGRSWNFSNARIKRELGWKPEITLRQSLADTMATIRLVRAGRDVS